MIERVRAFGFADALALAGVGLGAAGLIVTGDGLVSAAQHTPGSAVMNWEDRLLLGLWSFRLEHTLWFTFGLVLLWLAFALGAELEGRGADVARVAGGVAIGFVLLAGAVVLGSTIVAVTGSVGSGVLEIQFTRNERIFTWLLQASSAAALTVTWLLAGSRLGERLPLAAAVPPAADDASEGGEPLVELGAVSDSLPAPVPIRTAPEPEPAAVTAPEPPSPPPAAAPVAEPAPPRTLVREPSSPGSAAQRVFQERLAYSPKRDEARRLLDEIARAEREGRSEDAAALAEQIDRM